jgi:hypothetical protein
MRLALALTIVLAIGARARADRAAWIGTQACGACHPDELAAWQVSPHAKAALAGAAPKRCYACHGTGDAPAGGAYWAEVGCEACHGAGAAYSPDDVMRDPALARELGLRDVAAARAQICAGCHVAGFAARLQPIDLTKPAHPKVST